MQKILIIIFFIIFSSSLSLAQNKETFTVEEIKELLLNVKKQFDYSLDYAQEKLDKQKKSGTWEKRLELKRTAKCMYVNLHRKNWYDTKKYSHIPNNACHAGHLRRVIQRTEQGEKRFPGDIFYALEAIENMVIYDEKNWKKFLKPHFPGKLTKYTLKKLEKLNNNPSNEKSLGKPLLNYVKQVRLVNDIRLKLGNGNLSLLGDLLNAVVKDVKKNNIRPDLKKRRILLNKYSLVLKNIKKKIKEENYKSIEEDISKLSKVFNQLIELDKTTNKLDISIDESVNIIKDLNKLIQTSAINAKENKDLALSTIYFMDYLIDSILSKIPEKYSIVSKPLTQDMFAKEDLVELENIIEYIIKKNRAIKSVELINSRNLVDKYINTSDIIKSFENFVALDDFDNDTSYKIANEIIQDNFDNEIFKDVKKLVQKMTENTSSELNKELKEITNQAASVTKEITKSSKVNNATQNKIGNLNLQTLVGASRRGYINLGRSF